MDKNMIHIDDLVRSRLQGGEEKERAGGWANMRDLLDKEMPAAIAEGAGNRRLYGLLLLLLIGTSLTVGGYQWASHYSSRSNGENAEPEALASSSKTMPQPSFAIHASRATAELDALTRNNSQPVQSSPAHIASASLINKMEHTPGANGNTRGVMHSASLTENNNEDINTDIAAITPTHLTNSYDGTPLSRVPAMRNKQKNRVTQAPASALPAGSVSSQLQTYNYAAATSGQVVTPDGLHLLLRRDSMQRIEIVEHRVRNSNERLNAPATLYYDTISMQMVAIYHPFLPISTASNVIASTSAKTIRQHKSLSADKFKMTTARTANVETEAAMPATKQAVLPAAESLTQPVMQASAASPTAVNEGGNMVSLSTLKVSSIKHNWWNPEQFNEMINKVQYRIAGVHITGGIEAGINASLGKGVSLGGFECGLTALIVINDMLSLSSGLYYYQRYNTGATVHDNYVYADPAAVHYNPQPISGVVYNHYSWLEDSVDHHYNYDKIQTIELPVLLRYGAGRFFGEAGLNMIYAFKMKASEVTIHADHVSQQQANYPTTMQPTFGTAPTITPDDFGARFGLGFAAGAGYHFSPAVTLNLHISKSLWDNAKTDGSRKISSDLYNLPSLQLSVGYRFSQQKASPTADR